MSRVSPRDVKLSSKIAAFRVVEKAVTSQRNHAHHESSSKLRMRQNRGIFVNREIGEIGKDHAGVR